MFEKQIEALKFSWRAHKQAHQRSKRAKRFKKMGFVRNRKTRI